MNASINDFDEQLQSSVSHYKTFPELMPYVGSKWNQANTKILFIGESHYLKPGSTFVSNSATWYSFCSSPLGEVDKKNIKTRIAVEDADNYGTDHNSYHCKAHSIFYNIKGAIGTALDKNFAGKNVFQNFSYYNYFQRPAEIVGGSINITPEDSLHAFKTLKNIYLILEPDLIIFLSTKAHDDFNRQLSKDNFLGTTPKFRIPHPACAWWNREIKRFNQKTGREEFVRVIRESGLEISG